MEKFNEKFSSYYDYFEKIRKTVYILSGVFVAAFVLGFLNAGTIMKTFIGIFSLENATIVATSPFQFLDLATKIGLYAGLIVCLPLLIYFVYDFLKDGLTKKEKKLFFILLPTGLVLFVGGFVYCFAILYFYLSSVSALNVAFGIKNFWDISSFLSQIILASVCLGLAFQFPIVLTFLIRIGVVKVAYLQEKRFYVIAGLFLFVGLLPPPDIFSTILEVFPLIVLFEITLWVNAPRFLGRTYLVKTATPALDVTNPAT